MCNVEIFVQVIRVEDLGIPPNSIVSNLHVCVTDFNDNAPRFIRPPQNITIRIPEVSSVKLINLPLTLSVKLYNQDCIYINNLN